ncbi:G-protein gamma subunit [Umbelopsis sp. AD052]|nr:G-protein gamma subunit [Umbelopsis sp. AD052]
MARQTLSETKLRKMTETNDKLKEQLEVQRIPVSDASKSLIEYCKSNHDTLVPSVWGNNKNQDPFAEQSGCTCCV